MMELYGSRMLCTHIHDNRGVTCPGDIDYRDDLHWLPFDGIITWEWVAKNLKATGYSGPLTLEIGCGRKEYREKSFEEYIKDAYDRAVKLREIIGD